MTKWVCKKELSFLKLHSVFYIDIVINKYDDPDNVFFDYLEIFDFSKVFRWILD
jgi:hypothetical protein